MTVHGFRSTFRDWAGNVSSFPREVTETALAHVIGDKAEQAYRRGDALEKRRNAHGGMGELLRAKDGPHCDCDVRSKPPRFETGWSLIATGHLMPKLLFASLVVRLRPDK